MASVALSLLVLKTRQMDRMRSFYHVLGLELAEEQHGRGPVHLAGQVGDVVLELYPLHENIVAADTTTRLGFTIEKLDEVFEALQALGTVVISSPQTTEWGYRAVLRDPDGRAVELSQR